MTNPDLTLIAALLDRSGSMESCKRATETSFNELIAKQRSEPGEHPGVCDYVFRIYGRKNPTPEERKIQEAAAEFFFTVSLQEDMPTQQSSQIMMEAGAVPSVLFGKREICLTRMHKAYDRAIGHDAELALRNNAAAMGISAIAAE